ncbi:hypothetical protein Ae201684_002183 [Aphanomyces euteiches]|uniref:START domain-containing protein n=1 Tax=Aphanomyces euteiches TaxID=100861 RepID=A0A6G0XRD9_9STRA|nr:hypothetical protein Ae201684_002183 [Aphanomyces euteiches]KAH9131742.1 hypothetical protein AeRB84_021671 [Aphanomyces euteiches]
MPLTDVTESTVPPPPMSIDERNRSLSSTSSTSSNDKETPAPSSNLALSRHGKKPQRDSCKICLRQFTKLLQSKRCYYCKNVACALCAFKIPMFHSEKSKLGKHSLHAHLCAHCYDTNILNQSGNERHSENGTNEDNHEDGTLILVDESTSGAGEMQQRIGLWLSLLTAVLMLAISLADDIDYTFRVCGLVGFYLVFVYIHPSIAAYANVQKSSSTASSQVAPRRPSSAGNIESAPSSSGSIIQVPTVDDYRRRKDELNTLYEEFVASKEWVKNESKSTANVPLYEIDSREGQPIFKAEAFIPGTTPEELLSFLSSADSTVRRKWDTGMASNEVIETMEIDGVTLSVVHNTQKPHGFGLVSSRDFVNLAFRRDAHVALQGVVDRPDVIIKPGVLRGQVLFVAYVCTPAEGGCHMTYYNHVEIGGSLPKKLVSNGTADNVMKMMSMCIQSKKKWFS